MTPDFSSDALKYYLAGRIAHEARTGFPSAGRSGERAAAAQIRRLAKVSTEEFDAALKGLPLHGSVRAKIWTAMGVDPAHFGVLLEAADTTDRLQRDRESSGIRGAAMGAIVMGNWILPFGGTLIVWTLVMLLLRRDDAIANAALLGLGTVASGGFWWVWGIVG